MKRKSKKTKIATIALVLLMTSVIVTLYMPVQAQSLYEEGPHGGPPIPIPPPDYPGPNYATEQPVSGPLPSGVTVDRETDTETFLSFRPNPIGLGQSVLINFWINPGLASNHRFLPEGFLLTITKPDGTQKQWLMHSEPATAANWLEYVVDQTGEWKIKLEFRGTYFPAGFYHNGYVVTNITRRSRMPYSSAYYRPSSTAEQTLTVQEDMVYSWPPAALPTDYWTRPVSLNNREWWSILGNWPGDGYLGGGTVWDELYPNTNPVDSAGRYNFNPWVKGPNSAHIVWRRQGDEAGLIGGPAGIYGDTGNPGSADVIYNGRGYETMTVTLNGVPTRCAVCYDLRTGEMHYAIPTADGGVSPNRIAYYGPAPGALATRRFTVDLISISGGQLRKVNPYTGAVSEYPIESWAGGLFYQQYGGYVLAPQNIGNSTHPNYRLINWTTSGSTNNFANRVVSNVSWPWRNRPNQYSSAYGIVTCDFNEGLATFTSRDGYNPIIGELDILWGIDVYGYNMETQQMLGWEVHLPDQGTYSGSCVVSDHGKTAILDQKGVFECYDMRTGTHVWTSDRMDYPWGATSFGAYSIASAYGMFFRQSYDGVYAFNWTNGDIVWKYTAPAFAHFESPYITDGVEHYSFNSGCEIADGKMYVYNSEHSTTWPITRGWGLHCIDIYTGELIWKIKNPMSSIAIADGYLVVSNSWDGYTYCFGKGKSTTTVTAPKTEIPLGQSIVLEGTVLDMSPAQPGTPCVSKDSMTTQMEYLHLQMPIAGLWNNETITGVPVSLDTVDPNGNFIHIGDVTTDGYSGTFGHAWTPEVPGTYTIMATFGGDESYGSSFAQTYVTVGEAPEPYPEPPEYGSAEWPEYPEAPAYTAVDLAIIAAVAVAIVIGIVNLWALRKRQ